MRSDRVGEGAALSRPLAKDGSPVAAGHALGPGEVLGHARSRWRTALVAGTTVAYSAGGLFLFVLALQLLKSGAGGLKPVLKALSAHGEVNLLGFGWLGAYGVMSGSPVAAISLSLLSRGTISDVEAFA